MAPVVTMPQVPTSPPAPMMVAPAVMVPQAPQAPVVPTNTGVLEAKVDALAKTVAEFATIMSKQQSSASGDFNQVVANLSGQFNETNKALKELSESMKALREAAEVSFVALHHLYLCSPMAAQAGEAGKNAQTFKEHLKQYVPR